MTGLVDWAVKRSRMILAMVILAIGAGRLRLSDAA